MSQQINSKTTSILYNKCEDLIIQLNKSMRDFPSHEKYGLQSQIRNSAYDILAGVNFYALKSVAYRTQKVLFSFYLFQ